LTGKVSGISFDEPKRLLGKSLSTVSHNLSVLTNKYNATTLISCKLFLSQRDLLEKLVENDVRLLHLLFGFLIIHQKYNTGLLEKYNGSSKHVKELVLDFTMR